MDGASQHLQKAIALGMDELTALRQGDVEKAVQLAEERTRVTALAWTAPHDVPKDALKQLVTQLDTLQKTLTQEALHLKESIRGSLNNTHKQQRRMTAYQRAASHAV